MDSNILPIIGLVVGGLLVLVLIALFFISRRSMCVMDSMINIMLDPDRAKVRDASRVLQTIMADEMAKIIATFQSITKTLQAQVAAAETLRQELGNRSTELVNLANDAVLRVSQTSDRMDNTVSGLNQIVNSESWVDASHAAERFADVAAATMNNIKDATADTTAKINAIDEQMAKWIETGQKLDAGLQNSMSENTANFDKMAAASANFQESITALGANTTNGFNEIKSSASEYEETISNTNKVLATYLAKLDGFEKQSKKHMTNQLNTLTNTANIVGAQVMLTESSVEKQIRKLTEAVETVIASATETESSVRGISTELAGLTNHFESEIKEFATGVVSELKTVSGVANTTLQDTKSAANAFSESVKSMATGVRETLIEMNTAHTQLTGQSAGLIKMSNETTEQLRPLAELIEKYYRALPDLANTSETAGANLATTISELDARVATIRDTVVQSTAAISESAAKLDDLAATSRQQMIDLMSDYTHAVENMQTLNKQIMVARATAPMDAVGTKPATTPMPRASSRDFIAQSSHEFDKLYEQSVDLTRAMGGDIPDVVWQKYHDGDKTIFAKWMAKMVRAAGKKQIRELIKSDSVFKSQATQFVRGFDKMMAAAKNTDTPDKLSAALLKTDLGIIYSALSSNI